jgi:DNA-binding transcriptional MocR family regulator
LEKEKLFQRIQSMIMSSTKKPKYMSISTVKVADILGVKTFEIEQGLKELVSEGKLKKSKIEEPPHQEIYLLSGD